MKKKKILKILSCITLCLSIIVFSVIVIKKERIKRELKELKLNFEANLEQNSYNAKNLALFDLSKDEIFISKNENEQIMPASLAKLFVIEYALSIVDLNDIVDADYETIALIKPNSSVAGIEDKQYYVHNLIEAMLVPSGNDAAYVLAKYCGQKLTDEILDTEGYIEIFMKKLNDFFEKQGYQNTILFDPSGYDFEAKTSVIDLKMVTCNLLKFNWFRNIVGKSEFEATLPDGSTKIWRNTNNFLNEKSKYYNPNVIGIKTGALGDDYNLIALYKKYNKEFLICSIGSKTSDARYFDANYIIKTIDRSDYLKK